MTTIRLQVTLDPATDINVYAMAGTATSPMTFPPAFQLATPFGADIGGANAAFFAIMADAEFDSWLTIGSTDGTLGGAIAASPGLGLDAWTESNAFTTDNGAIFFMTPADGPGGAAPIVVAQITSATPTGTATATFQGQSEGGVDWVGRAANWSW